MLARSSKIGCFFFIPYYDVLFYKSNILVEEQYMIKAKFSDLNYPRGLGLSIISEYLTDTQMEELITKYRDLPRKQRRVILPSRLCTRKVFFHYVWKQILKGRDWKKIRENFKPFGGTLVLARASKCDIRECYNQREKEIMREST